MRILKNEHNDEKAIFRTPVSLLKVTPNNAEKTLRLAKKISKIA